MAFGWFDGLELEFHAVKFIRIPNPQFVEVLVCFSMNLFFEATSVRITRFEHLPVADR